MFSTVAGAGMDPITATQNAIASFFNFLTTEQGQAACKKFLELDAAFHQKLHDLFDKIHNDMAK